MNIINHRPVTSRSGPHYTNMVQHVPFALFVVILPVMYPLNTPKISFISKISIIYVRLKNATIMINLITLPSNTVSR